METITIKEPEFCPYCHSKVKRQIENGAHIYCTNPMCPERAKKKISYFVSKECMNIDGLSEKTIEKLYENNTVSYWWDFYNLTEQDLKNAGCGEKTSKNIYNEFQKSKFAASAANVLLALGIPMVGKVTTKLLLEHFKTIKNIENATLDELNSVDGIGEVCARCIYDYMQYNKQELEYVYKYLQTEYKSDIILKNTALEGKIILATGTLKNFSREGIKQSVVENGGKYASSVSKKLSFLIVGDSPGKNKIDKAKELEIPMVSEEEYLNMIK